MRSVQLINAFGRGCDHAIVSAMSGALDAASHIDRGISVDLVDFPGLQGRPTPARLQRLASAMQGHDLVLTHGYGVMNAVMAHTIFGARVALPPLVHHEDAPGPPNAVSNWYRRIALGRAAAVVVTSARLETIAVDLWHQPRSRVKCIPPGIRTAAYAAKPRGDALPRVIKRNGESWLGTWADPHSPQEILRLLRGFATLPDTWQLVILGEAPARDAIRDAALRLDLGHRVHLPGGVAEPARVLGLFDLFALAADDRSALIQAMAAGLAVVASDGGAAAIVLAPENRAFVAPPGDDAALAAALGTLAGNPLLRGRVGMANRVLARTMHDEAAMVAAYRKVYGAVLGRDKFP